MISPYTDGTLEQRESYQTLCYRWQFVGRIYPMSDGGWVVECRNKIGKRPYVIGILADGSRHS